MVLSPNFWRARRRAWSEFWQRFRDQPATPSARRWATDGVDQHPPPMVHQRLHLILRCQPAYAKLVLVMDVHGPSTRLGNHRCSRVLSCGVGRGRTWKVFAAELRRLGPPGLLPQYHACFQQHPMSRGFRCPWSVTACATDPVVAAPRACVLAPPPRRRRTVAPTRRRLFGAVMRAPAISLGESGRRTPK